MNTTIRPAAGPRDDGVSPIVILNECPVAPSRLATPARPPTNSPDVVGSDEYEVGEEPLKRIRPKFGSYKSMGCLGEHTQITKSVNDRQFEADIRHAQLHRRFLQDRVSAAGLDKAPRPTLSVGWIDLLAENTGRRRLPQVED